jgi:hypothetical protein
MAVHQWELQQRLSTVLPLNDGELMQIITHTDELSVEDACTYFNGLLGDSQEALTFISAYAEARNSPASTTHNISGAGTVSESEKQRQMSADAKPIDVDHKNGAIDEKHQQQAVPVNQPNAAYAPPPGRPPTHGRQSSSGRAPHNHTNPLIEAARLRAIDEVGISMPICVVSNEEQQEMQQMLQNLQFQYAIYNPDIEPEHETDYPCNCPIHQYQYAKYRRYRVQDIWSNAVLYPGTPAPSVCRGRS